MRVRATVVDLGDMMTQDDRLDARGFETALPCPVGQLATTVISVVRDRQTITGTGVRQFVLDHLMRAISSRGVFDPVMTMEEMRGHRLGVDLIIDVYIPCAARTLGSMWDRDEISFATVTVGALRLQSLLAEASAECRMDLAPGQHSLAALIVVPQGEQHFLSASVAAAQLRRMACEVTTSFDETLGELNQRARQDPPDLVLISSSQAQDLERVCQTVLSLRTAIPSRALIALGGALTGDRDSIKEQTGVDIMTSVVREAVSECARRAKAQLRG